jgi:hypothetical protein
VLFVLAICGGPLVSTSAAAGASVLATVQAEQMTLPAGATVVSNRGDSGGAAVRLTQPGSALTGSLTLAGAATSLQVVAEGTRCQQGWPTVTAAVDGVTVLNGTAVSSTSWKSYGATVSLGAGAHTISISDSAATSCRTLSVDAVIFDGTVTPAPTVSLAASPASIASGGASSLTWSSTHATSCVASGGWSGSEPTAGSLSTGALAASTQYVLSCTGPGGSSSASTTVTVNPAPTKVCQSVAIPAYF